jgi:soluble P-type ATPase
MPVNNRSLFATVAQTIEKINNSEIDINAANAIANLVEKAYKLHEYELKRAIAEAHPELGRNVTENLIRRNIEIKKFDALTE